MPLAQRLGDTRAQDHDLDAETGIDGLDLVAEQPGRAFGVAHRQGRADADGLDVIVDPVTEKIEPPRPEALPFQRCAERIDELADIAGDGFGRTDRLRKAAAGLDEIGRADRIDRIADASQRLIDATTEFGTEPQRQRCAR